jgi:hypothetical protein
LCATPALADDAPSLPACTKDGAPVADDYLQLARDIMTATKTSDRMTMELDTLLPPILDLIRKASPELPDNVMADLRVSLRDEMLKALPDLLTMEACVYVEHFSKDELGGLLAFYQSPLGRKLLTESPAIFKENVAMGQVWGERAGRAAMEHVLAKYRKDGTKT